MALLLIFFLISILFSFLCSIWEAVLLSITPSYAERKLQEGGTVGKLIQQYKRDIDRPLSAILTLNTIAHTAGAIGVGAQASVLYGKTHWDLGLFSITAESLIAGLMTLAILVLSEIIPKTIGANRWRSLAPYTVRALRLLLIVLAPFVWLSKFITSTFNKGDQKSILSRADFAVMAQVGEESGALAKAESTIIRNLLELQELEVRDIMTPRSVMVAADEETKLMDFYKSFKPLRFSRIPVYQGSPDQITGLILKDVLLQKLVENEDDEVLREIKMPIHAIKDDESLGVLFNRLTEEKLHILIVVDEFGSLAGLVTMEDLMETLLGFEIVDESDAVIDMQRYARDRWEKRARELGLIE